MSSAEDDDEGGGERGVPRTHRARSASTPCSPRAASRGPAEPSFDDRDGVRERGGGCGKEEGAEGWDAESVSLGIFAEGRGGVAEADSDVRKIARLLDADFEVSFLFLNPARIASLLEML